jgi:uncharacterized membrane protein YqgA involved in biofilm formation
VIHGLGTALNTGTVLLGAATGLGLKRFIPRSLQQTMRTGLGLFTAVVGIQMALKTHNSLLLLASLLLGLLAGELRLNRRGGNGAATRVAPDFVTASVLFCVGPLAILAALWTERGET